MNLEVKFDAANNETYVSKKIGKQTLCMGLQPEEIGDTLWLNLYIAVYNKRSHINRNEQLSKVTGLNPIETLKFAIEAFKLLEQDALEYYPNKFIIYCYWLDSRRRDVYNWFLSRKGFHFDKIPETNKKCLLKKYPNAKER